MKKFSLFFIVFFALMSAKPQKIVKDVIDEFEGIRIIETNWIQFLQGMDTYNIKFSSVGTKQFMSLKIMASIASAVFAVEEGEGQVIFLLSDGNTIRFTNTKYAITGKGKGATGFAGSAGEGISLTLVSDDLNILLTGVSIIKMRVYTSNGRLECEINEKKSKAIINSYRLIYERIKKL